MSEPKHYDSLVEYLAWQATPHHYEDEQGHHEDRWEINPSDEALVMAQGVDENLKDYGIDMTNAEFKLLEYHLTGFFEELADAVDMERQEWNDE